MGVCVLHFVHSAVALSKKSWLLRDEQSCIHFQAQAVSILMLHC